MSPRMKSRFDALTRWGEVASNPIVTLLFRAGLFIAVMVGGILLAQGKQWLASTVDSAVKDNPSISVVLQTTPRVTNALEEITVAVKANSTNIGELKEWRQASTLSANALSQRVLILEELARSKVEEEKRARANEAEWRAELLKQIDRLGTKIDRINSK